MKACKCGVTMNFNCMDCKQCTSCMNEYYMVQTEVWEQAIPKSKRRKLICLGCLEKRLGRELTRADFTDAPINNIYQNSDRMMDRLHRM